MKLLYKFKIQYILNQNDKKKIILNRLFDYIKVKET